VQPINIDAFEPRETRARVRYTDAINVVTRDTVDDGIGIIDAIAACNAHRIQQSPTLNDVL
jgi:hypothetical protein